MKHRRLASALAACSLAVVSAGSAFAQELMVTEGAPGISGGAQSLMMGEVGSLGGPISAPGAAMALANPLPRVDKQFQSFQFADNFRLNGFYTIPPDPMGTASKSRLVAVVNVAVELRTKDGTLLDESGLRAFFGDLALGSPFDPKVVYDEHSGRLLVVALVRVAGTPNISQILLAVSKSDNPNTLSADDWNFAAIDSKTVISGSETWADYPGFEVDEEAIYITNNMFTFPGFYRGARLWIVDKGEGDGGFYVGGPANVTVHNPYASAGIATTTMPALVHGNGGVGGPGSDIGTFLVSYSGLSDGVSEYLQVVTVRDPLGKTGGPMFEQEFLQIGDIETGFPALPGAPQADTAITINTNDRRALDAVWRDGALWMVTTIRPNANFGPDQGQATATWFKVDTSQGPGSLVIADGGVVGGEDIAPGAFTFFPAIAVNRRGDMKIGFSASAPTIYAGAYVTGKRVEDPAGTVRPSNVVRAGEDYYYRTFSGVRNRWGDYSGIAVDPTNDKFFWIYNEYAAPRGNVLSSFPTQDGVWGTTWGRGRF